MSGRNVSTLNLGKNIDQDLKQLCKVIGARPSFSPANKVAAEYIAGRMQSIGFMVEMQSFQSPFWECTHSELCINKQVIPLLPNPFSPSCNADARLIGAGTIDELENLRCAGQILVIYGELTQNPIACKSWFLKEAKDERIIAFLEENPPAAILTVQNQPGSINRIIEDAELKIPSATLPAKSALSLTEKMGVMAHLQLDTGISNGTTANVIGRAVGNKPLERVILCAHYDTKIDTPGALDNASGIACMLGVAEQLLDHPLVQSLECIAFTNEEYLPIGDDTYLAQAGEGFLDGIRFVINFDGLGNRIGVNTLAIFSESTGFKTRVEEKKKKFPAVQWVEPWPQSNHSTFAWRGVPALAVSSSGAWTYAHQLEDSLRMVSSKKVVEAVLLAKEIILSTQDDSLSWFRQDT
jgi:aminopeptidase YwaD